ncbi:MAG: Spy/CpxP family protein refolding chaperone [Nitrospinae bacterium]|nr:Spy/CpxP family protein refolding chaperone [Nitrospinota bacterium]
MQKGKPAFLITLTSIGLLAFALTAPAMAASLRVAEAPKAEGSGGKAEPHTGMGMEYGKGQTPPDHGAAAGKAEGSASKEPAHPGSVKGYGHGSFAHGAHADPFEHVLCFRDKLGLTPDQVAQIEKLRFEYKKQAIQSGADHEIAHLEMDKLAHSATVDEAAMHALADKIAGIKSKSIHAMVDAKIAVLKLLTDEQRKKVSDLHSKR